MTNLELKQALRALEARVEELEKRPVVEPKIEAQIVKEEGRAMCPHCGVKPNHFFHVKTCAKKKNKNDGDKKDTPS